MTVAEERRNDDHANHFAAFALLFFLVYFAYLVLFIDLATEAMNWITLVLLPFLGVFLLQRHLQNDGSIKNALERVGFVGENLRNGTLVGLLVGAVLGLVQLFMSGSSDEIREIIVSGKVLYAFPLAFLLMLVTSGFTEEFFFRGVFQTSWARYLGKTFWSIVASSALFGLYHLPYAYLLDSWSSQGDLGAAVSEGVLMATVVGMAFGSLYARYNNLLVPILCHSMFNAMWAMTLFA